MQVVAAFDCRAMLLRQASVGLDRRRDGPRLRGSFRRVACAKKRDHRPPLIHHGLPPSKYPPAEPGALDCEPLKAARTGRCRGPKILSLRSPASLIEDRTNSQSPQRSCHLRHFPTLTTHCGHSGFTLPLRPSRNSLSCAWRLTIGSFVDGLPEMSNCYCHPGRAGGSPLLV